MRPDEALLLAARASPAAWGYLCTGGSFRIPPHIELLDRKLRDLAARRIKGLIVEMPPRHGKSEEGTNTFPGWYAGTFPDHRIMLTGYGAKLAATFGRRVRDDLTAFGSAVFGVTVDPSSSAADQFAILGRKGGVVTAGVGGSLTGMGADLLVIDDPVKNQDEAQSETYRQRTWDWWTSTARTRLHPGGVVLVIQTRWHEDDLAGRMQQDLPEGWEVLRLPAVAEEDDPLGRAIGEPLWPERYDLDALREIERSVGSYVWNALYQQRPVAADGNMVRRSWLRFWTTLETGDRRDMNGRPFMRRPDAFEREWSSWDLAFKDTDGSDFVVGGHLAGVGADRFLLDMVRGRMDYPATRQALRASATSWPRARAKLVEDKANGPALLADLGREIEGLIAVNPQGGKIARLVAVSPIIEAGNFWLPDPAMPGFEWVNAYIAEMLAFPNGRHDDQVDMTSQGLVWGARDSRVAAGPNPFDTAGQASGPKVRDATGRRIRRQPPAS